MKKLMITLPILLVIVFIFFISEFRFTAVSSAKNHSFLENDAELIGEYKVGSSFIFLFKSDKEELYRTVLTEKDGLFYRSNVSTYTPYSSDKIQTAGVLNVSTGNTDATFISIISNDEEVSYIEVGVEPNVKSKRINMGERVTFLFPVSKQIYLLNPTAFNKDGEKLFYYGLPKDTNVFNTDDIKWHKVAE
ncbi:hypothetical protein F9B85_11930 [Heliorestis acidaminivorans]|uniref:Uncharacterized protein n=2 Tax=Heliorestis TaxID=79598 RepID=A0A6I0EQ67_9FIRM|nr:MULTISPECIES: hypothetical protein [Heliorestis]KAB2951510.1 hypothetical protein F9B85_11930 [Heliorestis acidaminivorans]QGG48318.1 hypothetical protein FTV88_2220 [Heliorestis convoluta]